MTALCGHAALHPAAVAALAGGLAAGSLAADADDVSATLPPLPLLPMPLLSRLVLLLTLLPPPLWVLLMLLVPLLLPLQRCMYPRQLGCERRPPRVAGRQPLQCHVQSHLASTKDDTPHSALRLITC